jgi:hypothetical protein
MEIRMSKEEYKAKGYTHIVMQKCGQNRCHINEKDCKEGACIGKKLPITEMITGAKNTVHTLQFLVDELLERHCVCYVISTEEDFILLNENNKSAYEIEE